MEKETTEEKRNEMKETGSMKLDSNNRKHNVRLLTIIGEIEGHEAVSGNTKATKYEHLLPMLAEVEDSEEIDGLLILLNTMGGDVRQRHPLFRPVFARPGPGARRAYAHRDAGRHHAARAGFAAGRGCGRAGGYGAARVCSGKRARAGHRLGRCAGGGGRAACRLLPAHGRAARGDFGGGCAGPQMDADWRADRGQYSAVPRANQRKLRADGRGGYRHHPHIRARRRADAGLRHGLLRGGGCAA